MSSTATPLNVDQWIHDAVPKVFETMLGLTLEPAPDAKLDHAAERVVGSIGLGGETVTGAVYLHMSVPLAVRVTGSMLGLPPEEPPGDSDLNDVVGELCNMVAGGLKSTLCDVGAPCAVSTPTIIRGSAFHIETTPDVPGRQYSFLCEGHCLTVEVHLKLN